jgi:hypothetical protein
LAPASFASPCKHEVSSPGSHRHLDRGFVSFEQRLLVEADGSQHAESEDDKQRDCDLSERGFRILRFWSNDILLRSQSVLQMIFDSAAPSPSPVCAPEGAHPPSPTRGEGKEAKSE